MKLSTRFTHSPLSGIFLLPALVIQALEPKYAHVTVLWWKWRLDIYRSVPWENDPKNPLSRF